MVAGMASFAVIYEGVARQVQCRKDASRVCPRLVSHPKHCSKRS
jgi:hypothetical protein